MTDMKVDNDWKEEAKAAKDVVVEAEKKDEQKAFVAVDEVAMYLTELSNVLTQFAAGVHDSMEAMLAQSEQHSQQEGDTDDVK